MPIDRDNPIIVVEWDYYKRNKILEYCICVALLLRPAACFASKYVAYTSAQSSKGSAKTLE